MTNRKESKSANRADRSQTTNSKQNLTMEPEKVKKDKTKLAKLVSELSRPNGATIAELAAVTGRQNHSVRGALAGMLKKKGFIISSEKIGSVRRYRIDTAR